MKRLFSLIIILSFSSCRYFNVSPVNGITTKNLSEKPLSKDIVGIWEVDKYSYELIQENGYEPKKVILKIKSDGNFEAINFPDFMDVFSGKISKKYINVKGKWSLTKDFEEEKWVLLMDFENNQVTDFDLFLEENKLIIWTFIGDPDSGNKFLFRKK